MVMGMTGRRNNNNKVPGLLFAAVLATSPAAMSQQIPTPGLSPDNIPAWLTEALARESGPFELHKFTVPERSFSAEISGTSISEVQETSRGWYVSADIEATTPMECWIFTAPVDMAASLRNIAELNVSASVKAYGEVTERAFYYLDAGVIDSAPFMALEMFYVMQDGDQQRPAIAKVRIARVDDIHLACSHNQIGFRETFSKNFAQLVSSASFDYQEIQPFYRQVYRQSIDGLGLGIIDLTMTIDEDGDLALKTIDSMLVPDTGGASTATDTFDYGFFGSGFELINLRTIGSTNGAISYNLTFQPAGENTYRVVGTSGEENLDFGIEDDKGHMSIAERMLDIQAILADPDRTALTFRTWQPRVILGSLTETTLSFDGGSKEKLLATVTSGDNSTQVQLDEKGSYISTRFNIEMGEFAIERILDDGDASRLEQL